MSDPLAPFLELDEAEARRQWERIRNRLPRPRQEPFLPVEVLLCYGLFRLLDPHGFGGRNVEQAPPVVHVLARTTVRTPGSILSKMLNLDGSRTHGARLEVLLWTRLGDEPQRYAILYPVVFEGARRAGWTDDDVPDFLGWLSRPEVALCGQDELGPEEIQVALQETREHRAALEAGLDVDDLVTTRVVEQRVRLGQHRFARATLKNYDFRCGFCGFSAGPIQGARLLTASHIKPWRVSTDRERLDVRNGIAACPMHDIAFDEGLLGVNGGLRIHRAHALEELVVRERPVAQFFGERALRDRLLLPDEARPPLRRYLDYHRDRVFARRA